MCTIRIFSGPSPTPTAEKQPTERYPSIGHAAWDGLHLADLVMPAFLFIVGGPQLDQTPKGLGLRTSLAGHCLENIGVTLTGNGTTMSYSQPSTSEKVFLRVVLP